MVCYECLEIAKKYTIRLSELIEENYSNIMIVFSGARGFHIHVLDFQVGTGRFTTSMTRLRATRSQGFATPSTSLGMLDTRFDEPHFTLSVDPMRL
jgi:hypothetical protein